ncbi:MAG: hypothetical protein ACXABK_06215 [Candidatus Heimdallarchaeaceae archaeon]|jgi:hypothetical protein
MIPGTLRPLPKKIKEVKADADTLLRTVEHDLVTTKEMLKKLTSWLISTLMIIC